jgi:hypothetical protein
MRRPLIIVVFMLLAGATVFLTGHHLAAQWCVNYVARPTDDLAWLRLEFRLSDADLARVRELHDGYLPKCRDFCERIGAGNLELQAMLASGTNEPAAIERKLLEIGEHRARCQAAMLQHFQDVSRVMPLEQGRRYLAEMRRLTLGFHDQIERSMSPNAASPHGHQ